MSGEFLIINCQNTTANINKGLVLYDISVGAHSETWFRLEY